MIKFRTLVTNKKLFLKVMSTKVELKPLKIQKPDIDQREYDFLTLENELQVLLVSDPATDFSAASMNVGVGHFHDPEDVPGIAHFLEHMLFLGTKKYPDESSYQTFIQKHGGGTNAYTDMQNTNYYFSVSKDHLEGALDRFSQFFIAPLLNEEVTDREMKAVHSEHQKNLQNDVWRIFQFIKSKANLEHPFHKFGTGSLETLLDNPQKLGIKTRDVLLKFHDDYYSANQMKLVIYGKESIEELKKMAIDKFSEIKNKKVVIEQFKKPEIFEKSFFAKEYKIVPVKDSRKLILYFVIPEPDHEYMKKASNYYSHLLGHEGPGSIFAYLKEKGYATALSSGNDVDFSDKAIFNISIDLTKEGENHIDSIVEHVFYYIKLLKESGVKQSLFDECKDLQSISFRFREKRDVAQYVSGLSVGMFKYKPEHVVSGRFVYEYDEKAIKELMNYFTIENLSIFNISKKHQDQCDQNEKWYKTPYTELELSKERIEKWKNPKEIKEIHLPKPNLFIPHDLSVKKCEKEEKYPSLILENKYFQVYHKQDTEFNTPKVNLFFDILLPNVYTSPQNLLYGQIYCDLVSDALNEFYYDARLSGITFQLSVNHTGFAFETCGYSDKILVWVEKVFEKLFSLNVQKERFDIVKERVEKNYVNFAKNQPYQHVRSLLAHSYFLKKYHSDEYLKVLPDINLDFLKNQYIPLVFSILKIETFIHGNMTEKEALTAVEKIETFLWKNRSPLPSYLYPFERVIQLPKGKDVMVQGKEPNLENNNSAIEVLYQLDLVNEKLFSTILVFESIIETPFYSQLRTQEQIGYLVWSMFRYDHNVCSFALLLQSSEKSPKYILGRCESFIDDFYKTLVEMDEKDIDQHIKSAIEGRLKKDQNLYEQSTRFVNQIRSRQFCFDRKERVAKILATLTKKDIIEFYEKYIKKDSQERKRLIVQIYSKQFYEDMMEKGSDSTILVSDVIEFKNNSSVYPGFIKF